jgi:glucose-6-phosphate dehydrogenase assembly protein OpcA
VSASSLTARSEVAPDKIEAALAARWRCIAEEAHQNKSPPVTRAFLWNLVMSGPADQTPALVDQLAKELPARAIVVSRVPAGDGKLRTYVETNFSGHGAQTVGSDEITIEIGGTDAVAKPAMELVESIVRSALVPDALTALVWVDTPPPPGHPTRALLSDIDRLILDTRYLPSGPEGEQALGGILAIGNSHPQLELVDLAWLGISPLRGLTASMFDPPRDPSPLWKLDEVTVISGVDTVQVRGLLMLGWLGARLGWREPSQERGKKPGQRLFRATRADGGEVRLCIETVLDGARHGVRELDLVAGDQRWSLRRDNTKIDVAGPDLPPRQQPARSHSVGERLAEALGNKGRDANYRPALAFAAALAGAVSE